MDMKTLRKRCAARIHDLPVPIPFDTQIFVASLAGRRGRPIVLCPMALRGESFGAWIAELSVDVVFYEERTAPLHQRHIILHELGHILCDHEGLDGTDLAALLSGTDPADEGLRAPRGTRYTDAEEQEAEMIATLILTRISGAHANTAAPDAHVADTLQLLDSLEGLNDGG